MPVPIAVIVCEGDIETIVHISKALASKLPVIVMKRSGAVADIVVDYLEKYNLYSDAFIIDKKKNILNYKHLKWTMFSV